MKLRKLLPCLMALTAIPAMASATDAVAKRVGPVSYYGALGSSGGEIIGLKNNQKAMVRGMSLFWSDATGLPYYSKNVIKWAVDNLKIDVIRFAMGITSYGTGLDSKDLLDQGYSYAGSPDGYKSIIDKMVEIAVENDIYIIIDWHSHRATSESGIALSFFKEMAQKYGKIPNVIFEIFNEPVCSAGEIQSYANSIVPAIRANSENLIIIGTPSYSANPGAVSVNGTNLSYALHFYAASHSVGDYGGRATSAKGQGKAVFISEYGTVDYTGGGSAVPSTDWFNFMDQNNFSSCNWSLRQAKTSATDTKNESSAMFEGYENLTSKYLLDKATYTASGKYVKNYLTSRARSWNDSLTKGKHVGSCAFDHVTAMDTMATVVNALKPGCTYTSSNENVVTINGSNLTVNGAGYAILTGNDNSQSVVTIDEVPGQSIVNFNELTCTYARNCSSNRVSGYSNDSEREWIITTNTKTNEGSSFTLTSLDPTIVDVKSITCSTTSCSAGQSGKKAYVYQFKSFGTARIVATAPSISGYRAMNDTILVSYTKGGNKIHSNFKNTKLALGETAPKLLPDTSMYEKGVVTYTFNGSPTSPYVTQSGNALIAGSQNAIVRIEASVPETEHYKALNTSVRVIVGDSASAVNLAEYNTAGFMQTNPALPIYASIYNNQLNISSKYSENMDVEVFSVNGQKVMSKVLGSENTSMSLAKVPNGSYLITIRQGSRQLNLKWNKVSK